MSWHRRFAAVALVVLAVSGTILWAHIVDRYVAASDARATFWQNVGIVEVRVPTVTSPDQEVPVGVRFYFGNPSGIALEIIQISYRFYMDNLTDSRPLPDKADDIFVAAGGYFPTTNPAVVGSRSSLDLWTNLTVRGATQPEAIERLNMTFNENYYPIIDADVVYRIHGTTIVDRVLGIFFQPSTGVPPSD